MKNKYEEKNSKMEYKEKEKAQDLKQELKAGLGVAGIGVG